jgi:murein DD-endopeptidase MepM/ murein hydrolase activator NlpD
MADDPSKQVEIEVALRDTASSVLKDISKNIDEVSRKLVETGRKGSEAFDSIRRHSNETNESTKKTTENVSKLTENLHKLGDSLKGPLGLAATFGGIAISLERFISHAAGARAQLQLMTVDIGLSQKEINVFQQTLSRKGILDPETQKGIINQFFGDAMDLKTRGVYSEFWQRLDRFDPKFGRSFKESVDRGDMQQAWAKAKNMYADLQKAGNPALARYFAVETLHLKESTIANWDEYAKGVTAAHQMGEKETKKALEIATEAAKKAAEARDRLLEKSMQQILKWEQAVDKAGKTAQEVRKSTEPRGGTTPSPNATVKDRFPGEDAFKGQSGGSGSGNVPRIIIPASPGKRSSLDDDAIPTAARPVMFTRELVTTEKDSNKVLRDIRDLLEPTLVPDGGTGTGPTFRPGIRAGQRGPGGVPRSGGGDPGRGSGPTVETPTGPNQFGISSPTPGGWIGRGLGALPSAARGGHQGRDWMVAEGTTIGAPDNIKVLRAGNFGGSAGYGIEFVDSQGVVHKYFHLKEDPNSWLKKDSSGHYLPVERGVRIGTVGRTGNAAGGPAHIHIETRRKGKLIDPAEIYWPGQKTGTVFVPKDQMEAQKKSGALQQNFKGLSGRAGWFNDRTTASGLDPDTPGFAMRSKATMGQKFIVRDETTGKEFVATQTDWGPNARTGRNIDINAALARQFGYKGPGDFPTDKHNFSIRPIDSELGKTGAAGKTSQRGGSVHARVDFGKLKRQQQAAAQQPFKPMKLSSGRQNQSVHAGSVLPGDMDHSRWTV